MPHYFIAGAPASGKSLKAHKIAERYKSVAKYNKVTDFYRIADWCEGRRDLVILEYIVPTCFQSVMNTVIKLRDSIPFDVVIVMPNNYDFLRVAYEAFENFNVVICSDNRTMMWVPSESKK